MPYMKKGSLRPSSIPLRRMHEEEWIQQYRPSFEDDGSLMVVSEGETDTWVNTSSQQRIWSAVGREIWLVPPPTMSQLCRGGKEQKPLLTF